MSFAKSIHNLTCIFVYLHFLGMSYFLKTLKFAVVPKSITYLLNQRDDIKKQLRRAVSDGIKSGLVRPIHVLNETEGSRRVNKYVVTFIFHAKELNLS